MLELSGKDLTVSITKMIRESIIDSPETHKKSKIKHEQGNTSHILKGPIRVK